MATFLCPRPDGAIARVVVVLHEIRGESATVVDVDKLAERPDILSAYGGSYSAAVKFWRAVASVILVAGIVLSFVWQWWAFVPGFVIALVVYRANNRSAGDFVLELITRQPDVLVELRRMGLVWEVPANTLQRDR